MASRERNVRRVALGKSAPPIPFSLTLSLFLHAIAQGTIKSPERTVRKERRG